MLNNIHNNQVFCREHNLSPRLGDVMSLYWLIHSGKDKFVQPDGEGWFWLSNSMLGQQLPTIFLNDNGELKDKSTIYRTLVQLEKKGIVETNYRYNRAHKKLRYIRLTELGQTFDPRNNYPTKGKNKEAK